MNYMNINFSYELIGWEDYPSTKTPVKAALLNQMDSAIQFLYEQDGYLYSVMSDKVDAYLFDSYLLTATSFVELSQTVNAIDTELGTKEPYISLSPGWTRMYMESGGSWLDSFTDTIKWSLIKNTLTVSKERVMNFGETILNQTEISSDHITTTGSISAKEIALNNVSITQFSNSFTAEASADIAPTAQGVVNYVNEATSHLATVTDYEDTKFTLTNTATFTMLHQHIYQIGALVFIHLVFRTNAKVEEPGLFTLGKLDDSILPQHVHSFTVVPANPGVNDDMRVDPGYIALDGNISFDVAKSYSTKNYTFDITTFYCTDIASTIITE